MDENDLDAARLLADKAEEIDGSKEWDRPDPTADGHSFAWHGWHIVAHAADYLRGKSLDYSYYKPLFTRSDEEIAVVRRECNKQRAELQVFFQKTNPPGDEALRYREREK